MKHTIATASRVKPVEVESDEGGSLRHSRRQGQCYFLKPQQYGQGLGDQDPVELHRHHEVRRDHQPRSQVGGKWPGEQCTEAPRRDQGSRRSADGRAAVQDSDGDVAVPGIDE